MAALCLKQPPNGGHSRLGSGHIFDAMGLPPFVKNSVPLPLADSLYQPVPLIQKSIRTRKLGREIAVTQENGADHSKLE